MTSLRAVLTHAGEELDRRRVRYALVGGLAVSVHTEPRFTRDVDLAVAVTDDEEAEAVVRSLVGAGYVVGASTEQEAVGRLATARLRAPPGDDDDVVDLLFASSGIEVDIVTAAEPLEVMPGLTVPVACLGHLVALKLLARDDHRPQDEVDLRALLLAADDDERARAGVACAAIMVRGFGRGRPLVEQLATALCR